ncbi:RNA-directed DNA polymerase [Microtetraspora malaysiensis]|uniref:RNA-directed DNA polymerase n=1 Tax=Microtetraspora malaysiensis TaxID=161358 RepID=A0ABW6SKK7_9ACTN
MSGRHPAAHTLMPLVADPARLKRAARDMMRRPGAPGSDGVTWALYRDGFNRRIAELAQRLRDGSWQPGPVRLMAIPSWGKKSLPLAIPTVEDRIVHRALRVAAEPVLIADAYPPWMFGWRPRGGRVEAVAAATVHLASGRTWVADLDVAAATSGATVDDTMSWLARWIHDGTYLATVRRILAGLPSPLAPGSGLQPMLTNLRLARVDDQLTGLHLVRLTDNYTAFRTNRRAAEQDADRITAALAACGLAPNASKSKVWRPNPEDLYLAG